jgi:SAM-dependent methyltransferase
MDEQAYEIAARVENDHWWYRGRREVLAAVLDRHLPPGDGRRRVLEVGCGSGGNLALLAGYGSLFAVEKDDRTRERAAMRGIGTIRRGWLPDAIPFAGNSFDLIAALDVLEHVEDDAGSLRALRGWLTPRGVLLATVPAFQWLWSEHDVLSQHVRRYTRAGFTTLLRDTGFDVRYCGYFNSLLFPLAVANITLGRLVSRDAHRGLQIPPRGVNRALAAIFALESRLVPRVTLPFGLSIVACATRT